MAGSSLRRRVFNTLEIEVEAETSTIFGVNPTALQSDIAIDEDFISGTLEHYDGSGWTAGTWADDQKAGNFLALKFSATAGSTVTVELKPSVGMGKVTLDSDMNAVFRVTSPDQKLYVEATKGTDSSQQVFSLKGLELEADSE